MEARFWHDRWSRNDIAFHAPEVHPLLVQHVAALALTPGQRVFVPLCGKSLDLSWLLARGQRVIGCELDHSAVEQLFADLALVPVVTTVGTLRRYRAGAIEVLVGDVFEIEPDMLGEIAAVYDRGALVALPDAGSEGMRTRYAVHLATITANAPQLVISYVYDQQRQAGPPFAVDAAMLSRYYGADYELAQVGGASVPGGLKGICPAEEQVWLLRPRT